VDGVAQTVAAGGNGFNKGSVNTVNNGQLTFGYNANEAGHEFIGRIDDAAVWNRVLTASEVAAINAQSPTLPTGYVGAAYISDGLHGSSSSVTETVERGSNLLLDLAFEGVNGSSSFGQNISNVGSPYISTTQKYSGQSSAYFSGNGAAIAINNTALNIGTSDFLMDFYFKTDGPQNSWSVLVTSLNEAGRWGEIYNGTQRGGKLDFANGSIIKGGYYNDDQWHHVEAGQTGTTSFLKVDGVQTDAQTTPVTTHDFSQLLLGKFGGNWIGLSDNSFKGWIDDFKIKVFV